MSLASEIQRRASRAFTKVDSGFVSNYDPPKTRPVILVGPSLKGHEVTDMLHKALYHYLKTRFEGRLIIHRCDCDISLAKRKALNHSEPVFPEHSGNSLTVSPMRTSSPTKTANTLKNDEVKQELDVIFSLLNNKSHLVVLDCKAINYPSQVSESVLTPIVVYIKAVPKVVEKLIKLRGKKASKNSIGQILAARTLIQTDKDEVDIVIPESSLEVASQQLGDYLEQNCDIFL
ncbi:voltage-dependent L-type calcium channel subunit beta-4-like isoform X2 [Xenia sp. Carnegie-2017]|uniref:voltage-dependent L-type calcium channel subunit beta-4-like isoform X2 n=1 Tax=Xenia sp. Carnegie-2017 TaxID=2897299 RepID=UPI001F040BDF|nr:voltage-dependent L-type calcium channel subunit beta-4-like isoform X2 [Xenia sp. Carnegie-2017]XP_046862289.1 voltage-dependent L-type calcium channel subunit beta-4-like isoform X2 [Xenia sp. Carnegie-2017]